jgi:hypothetical protein
VASYLLFVHFPFFPSTFVAGVSAGSLGERKIDERKTRRGREQQATATEQLDGQKNQAGNADEH